MPKSYRETFEAQTGRTSDKWDSYLTVYDEVFLPYRDRSISLLEIGVQNGGSLEVHARYFANHQLIVGCDIHPLCASLVYPDHDKIRIVVGDANALETRTKIASLSADFDIIIDDGSHKSDDIILSFLNYFPRLKPGGLFVVEDLHASYWQGYGGGVFHPQSSLAFLKNLTDLVNLEHWGVPLTPRQYLAARHPQYASSINVCDFSGIGSVHFFNSICLITKHDRDQVVSLGQRRIRGTQADVWPRVLQMDGSLPQTPDQRGNKWSVPP
jgi:hypothetical protein